MAHMDPAIYLIKQKIEYSKFVHGACKVRKLASSKELLILHVALFLKSPNDAIDGSCELSKLIPRNVDLKTSARCSTRCLRTFRRYHQGFELERHLKSCSKYGMKVYHSRSAACDAVAF